MANELLKKFEDVVLAANTVFTPIKADVQILEKLESLLSSSNAFSENTPNQQHYEKLAKFIQDETGITKDTLLDDFYIDKVADLTNLTIFETLAETRYTDFASCLVITNWPDIFSQEPGCNACLPDSWSAVLHKSRAAVYTSNGKQYDLDYGKLTPKKLKLKNRFVCFDTKPDTSDLDIWPAIYWQQIANVYMSMGLDVYVLNSLTPIVGGVDMSKLKMKDKMFLIANAEVNITAPNLSAMFALSYNHKRSYTISSGSFIPVSEDMKNISMLGRLKCSPDSNGCKKCTMYKSSPGKICYNVKTIDKHAYPECMSTLTPDKLFFTL